MNVILAFMTKTHCFVFFYVYLQVMCSVADPGGGPYPARRVWGRSLAVRGGAPGGGQGEPVKTTEVVSYLIPEGVDLETETKQVTLSCVISSPATRGHWPPAPLTDPPMIVS